MDNNKIIQLLITELEKVNNTMCYALRDLERDKLITQQEHLDIRKVIHKAKPNDTDEHAHWWPVNEEGTRKRIEFLQSLI